MVLNWFIKCYNWLWWVQTGYNWSWLIQTGYNWSWWVQTGYTWSWLVKTGYNWSWWVQTGHSWSWWVQTGYNWSWWVQTGYNWSWWVQTNCIIGTKDVPNWCNLTDVHLVLKKTMFSSPKSFLKNLTCGCGPDAIMTCTYKTLFWLSYQLMII